MLTGVQDVGRLAQILFIGNDLRHPVTDAGEHGAVLAGRVLVRHVLKVVGQDQRRDAPLRHRDADGAVDQVPHLPRNHGLLHEGAGHVLEHADKIQLLLVVGADRRPRLLSRDGEHRHVVQPGVVQARDQVRCAGAGCRQADAEFARELGMGGGHEGRHFLVPGLDEFDLAVEPLKRAEQTVDAVARVTVDAPHAPVMQALPKEIADRLGHRPLPVLLRLRKETNSGRPGLFG